MDFDCIESGGGRKVLSITQELLVVDSCQERESVVLEGVVPGHSFRIQ